MTYPQRITYSHHITGIRDSVPSPARGAGSIPRFMPTRRAPTKAPPTRALAAAEPARWLVLDARLAPEQLAEGVWETVTARLPKSDHQPGDIGESA